MKIKLFVALFATVFGVSVFAAPQVTEEKAKAYAEQLAKTSDPARKALIDAYIVLGRLDKVETFQQIVDVCRASQKKYDSPEKRMNYQISQFACCWFNGEFADEGYEFAKKDGNVFVVYFILHRNLSHVTEQEKFNTIKTYLLEAKMPQNQILMSIKYLQNKSIVLGNDEEMKDILKKLNRIYTVNLGSDKAFWEPIVATVRLALSTY